MPYKIRYSSFVVSASVGALLAASLAAAPATAEEALNACDTATVTAAEAKRVAQGWMDELGYSLNTAASYAYRIGEAECVDGRWKVSVSFRPDPNRLYQWKAGVVLVNRHTAEIEKPNSIKTLSLIKITHRSPATSSRQ